MRRFWNVFVFFGIFFGSIIIFPHVASAIILPFGGKVVTSFAPPVVCPGEGPITIVPAGIAPVGPYAVYPATIRKTPFPILPNAKITGLYIPIPMPICWIPGAPPIPVTALPIIMFGSSSPL